MTRATVLQTKHDVARASGIVVAQAGSEAYFPLLGLIEAGRATLMGESWPKRGRVVTALIKAAGARQARELPTEQQRTITIGGEFFVTALKDYRDWPLKWWREAVQNAVDAGATLVELGSQVNADGTVTVWCDDNGRGMSEEILLNKFLVLGATTKTGPSGAAGGFGKAKELLLLPWISWKVESLSTSVSGAGISYTVKQIAPRTGTRLEVVMPADKKTDAPVAQGFLERCNLPHVNFTIMWDGKALRAPPPLMGAEVISQVPDKADIYYVPFADRDKRQTYLYVRTKGLYMFDSYVGEVPGYVLAELTAPSIEILTANRDGFRDWHVSNAIDKLAEKIAKDNKSALMAGRGLIRKKYQGTGKFKTASRASMILEQVGPTYSGAPTALTESDTNKIVAQLGEYAQIEAATRKAEEMVSTLPSKEVASAMLDQKFKGPDHVEAAIKQLVWEPDFYLMNDIDGFKVPKKFFPESMSPTILKLAKVWAELCRYVLIQLGSDRRFGVGFVFSEDAAAMAATDEDAEGRSESWLMLNPFKDMRSRKEVWRTSDADLKWLYAAAIHEATHIADGLSYHDESFASALTRNMAQCADGYRKIKQIAAGIKMRGGPELEKD